MRKCVVSCRIYLMYDKLTETQLSRRNFQLNKTNGSASTAQTSLTGTPGRQAAQTWTPPPTTTFGKFQELKLIT